jgi:ATP-binding protein involved in chromosome partitioning
MAIGAKLSVNRRPTSKLGASSSRNVLTLPPRVRLTVALSCASFNAFVQRMTNDDVLNALRTVKYPGYSRDIVSFGLVKEIQIEGGAVGVLVELTTSNQEIGRQIADAARLALRDMFPGLADAHVQVKVPQGQTAAPAPGQTKQALPGIRRLIAIASGKGGVGKSTCAANLACALSRIGLKVGLLDADIYGPSQPLMMGVKGRPQLTDDERIVPLESHGVKVMSFGLLVDPDTPVIWRGPMIQKTIQQFLHQVAWGDLDVLLVDLPPGTGDAQLSLCQAAPLDGGVVVTTPQEASVAVVRKGIGMFEKVNVPILGIVENMSCFIAPDGSRHPIFGEGGGRREAERRGFRFFGEVPLDLGVRKGGDDGIPVSASAPESPAGRAFSAIAEALLEALH